MSSTSEELFSQFCARETGTETQDFEEFCRQHPAHVETLRELYAEWLAVDDVVDRVQARFGEPEAQEQIEGFDLVGRLGQGGMGEVFLAEQKDRLHRRVVIKLIKLGMDTREVLARFESERQTLAQMNHAYIAQVHDAGTTSRGRPYFVMEYVPGQAISSYCAEHQLDVRQRVELFQKVCEAVQHAHQKGVIHRDLKPSNILVMQQDGVELPKVIDFGLAKAIEGPLTERTALTLVKRAVGTPAYMSPEQAGAVAAPVDTRTDVYSLGVVLYELLAGELPLPLASTSEADLLQKLREEDPPPPSRKLKNVTDPAVREVQGDLDWIALKALEKEPRRRYASCSELAHDLNRYLRHEVVDVGPPGQWYRFTKFVRRHRAAVAAVLAVVMSLALGLVIALHSRDQAIASEALARAEAEKVLGLSNKTILEELTARATNLWPCEPALLPDLRTLLDDAEELAADLPEHVAFLKQLRSEAGEASDPTSRSQRQTEWLIQHFTELVEQLQDFTDPQEGLISNVRERVDRVPRVVQATLTDAGDLWEEAIEFIADPDLCPDYRGLEIEPQLGLIPLEPDPGSGLYDFYVWESGLPPERHEDTENWLIIDETALVLTLVPGDAWVIGAQTQDPEADHYDAFAAPHDMPPHEVVLDPFFLSRYEMTRGQWHRIRGWAPPQYDWQEATTELKEGSGHYPVTNISWVQTELTLRQVGLTIPTEAQWEYASRARTSTPWWTGAEPHLLAYSDNLLDQNVSSHPGASPLVVEEWNDGFRLYAPVGWFRDNDFGLFDVCGNVKEWCRDFEARYGRDKARGGDGLHMASETEERAARGGHFSSRAAMARHTRREHYSSSAAEHFIGVRPSRPLRAGR
jgi:formylglycine-generating enzyme required for sulfatase activity/tRNA A-37 threonylcarbamoyl transferase component Bud32